MYSKTHIINQVSQGIGEIEEFYKNKIINYRGCTEDKKEYTEIIAEELLNLNIKVKMSSINEIVREKGYCVKSHNGIVTTKNNSLPSNRTEELFALKLFNESKNGTIFNKLGKVIDYQVPLKNKRDDKVGKIDLISATDDDIFLIELKTEKNKETLLRCILEISTYYQVLSKSKFIKSYPNQFKNLSERNIKKAILISENSPQYNESKVIKNSMKKLIADLQVEIFVINEDTLKVV
jgi:hypothetical protein